MLGRWPSRGRRMFYVLAFVLITAVTLALLLNSEPYEFAQQFVATDPRVIQVTGTQSDRRIALLKGFRYVFGDRTGEANFTFKVTGSRGTFDVRVVLKKLEGRWVTVRSQAVSETGAASDIVGADAP